MTSEEGSSSGDWSLVTVILKKSDDNQSDIEVISNPSLTDSELVLISNPSSTDSELVIMDAEQTAELQPPRLLYSEVLKKPAAPESDIEFVPEPATPELEFDDEEYLKEVLRSFSSEESEEEGEEEEECCFPSNTHEMKRANESVSKDVVLEVHLTLLSLTIIVGVSGMSGLLLGGIYSGVLTNNISPRTDLAEYPGVLPSSLYSDSVTCPDSGCESKLYRVEDNMKHLKETLSHDIRDCHYKLKTTVRQNAALHKTNTETAEYASKACAASRADIAELQAKSSALLSKLESQKEKLMEYKDQANREAAHNVLQILSLAQTLDNTKSDLEKARQAVSVLDGLNTECRKNSILSSYTSSKAVVAAKQQYGESNFWKNLYKHAMMDLEQADQKVADLEKNLKGELENLRESQVAESNAKINYLKERNSKHYFKKLADKYEDMLETMEKKYLIARSQEQQLGHEFETLKTQTKTQTTDMEYNLESCSNATVRAEQKAKGAIKFKQYVEAILINRISNSKEEYNVLKEMYRNQEGIVAEMEAQRASLEEMETQRASLEDSLIRKIASNRKKFLSARSNLEKTLTAFGTSKQATSAKYNILKSKVGKSRQETRAVREELEQSKTVISEYREQMGIFESYIKQIESQLLKLREDIIMREAIQREYILSKERQHEDVISTLQARYNTELQTKLSETKLALDTTSDTLFRRSAAFDKLQSKHDEMIEEIEEVESAKMYWRDAAKFQQHQAQTLSRHLENSKAGKFTAISEYKKTTELLLELIQDVASKPKCELQPPTIYYDQPTFSPSPPKSVTSPYMTSPLFTLSVVREDLCPAATEDEVLTRMKNSTGENFALLQQIYNSTSPDSELDTCYSLVSPLFPGVTPRTLADVINLTRSRDAGRMMSTALSKYWGGVDRAYNELYKEYYQGEVEGDEDWYFKRFKSAADRVKYPKGPSSKGEGKAWYSRLGRDDRDWYMARRVRKGEGEYSYVNKQKTKKQKGGSDCFGPYSSHFGC